MSIASLDGSRAVKKRADERPEAEAGVGGQGLAGGRVAHRHRDPEAAVVEAVETAEKHAGKSRVRRAAGYPDGGKGEVVFVGPFVAPGAKRRTGRGSVGQDGELAAVPGARDRARVIHDSLGFDAEFGRESLDFFVETGAPAFVHFEKSLAFREPGGVPLEGAGIKAYRVRFVFGEVLRLHAPDVASAAFENLTGIALFHGFSFRFTE